MKSKNTLAKKWRLGQFAKLVLLALPLSLIGVCLAVDRLGLIPQLKRSEAASVPIAYPSKYNCSAYALPSSVPAPPPNKKLKIMTFNVQFAESHDNEPAKQSTKIAENDAQMRSIAQAIKANSLDIVTLQEMDRYNKASGHPRFTCIKDVSSACCQPSVTTYNSLDPLMIELKNLGYPMYYAVGNYSTRDDAYKNQPYFVTLSRYPIVYYTSYVKGGSTPRDPLISVIQIGSKYLRVVNVHPQAPGDKFDKIPFDAYSLKDLPGTTNNDIKNSVGYLAGDFNSTLDYIQKNYVNDRNFGGFATGAGDTLDTILYNKSITFTKSTPLSTSKIIEEESSHHPLFGTLDITNLSF